MIALLFELFATHPWILLAYGVGVLFGLICAPKLLRRLINYDASDEVQDLIDVAEDALRRGKKRKPK